MSDLKKKDLYDKKKFKENYFYCPTYLFTLSVICFMLHELIFMED